MARKEGKRSLGVNTESRAEKKGKIKIILDELERRSEKGTDVFIDRLTGNED